MPGPRAGSTGRCAGRRRARRAFSPTTRRAITSPRPSSLSMREGHFLALHVRTWANLGAYVSTFGAAIPSAIYTSLLAGVYRTPAIFVESTGVFTNTTADGCLSRRRQARSLLRAGAACRQGRATSFAWIAPRSAGATSSRRSQMPYKTPIGPTYDCGDFPENFFSCAGARRRTRNFELRRAEARGGGRLRGIGLACYVESLRQLRLRVLPARSVRAPASMRVAADSRRARRLSARGARHPQSRPGTRHLAGADPLLPARRAGGADRGGRGRHRSRAVWHRHIRLAHHCSGRLRAPSRGGEGHCQRQADRRPSARSGGERHRVSPTAASP